MLKILPMYAGAFVAVTLNHFTVDWITAMEGVYIPPLGIFIYTSGLLLIEVTALVILTVVTDKIFHLKLLQSPYRNLAIGFLFAITYVKLSMQIDSDVGFLNNMWFIIIALPIFIILPLMWADHFLCAHRNRWAERSINRSKHCNDRR